MHWSLQPYVSRPAFKAWLNYLGMCAGLGAPGTLAEIARGYFGDTTAPERFASDAVVTAGPVVIGPGVGPVKLTLTLTLTPTLTLNLTLAVSPRLRRLTLTLTLALSLSLSLRLTRWALSS